MTKAVKNLISVIYGIGAIIVLILLVLTVFQSHIVLFPNAMLPMELHELASTWLSWGLLPMLIFSILFYKVHYISKSNHKIRNTILVYLPAIVCLVCALFWICVLAIGMVSTFINLALNGRIE